MKLITKMANHQNHKIIQRKIAKNNNNNENKITLKNFVTITGKHLCRKLFLRKLQAWKPATLLKRDSDTNIFLWIQYC